MMNDKEWQEKVVTGGETFCPECGSTNLTMGACAIGSMTVHQEYVCEDCQFEFKALFGLIGAYPT
jgi:transposase-like protein